MSIQAMTAYGVVNPNWSAAPNAAQIAAGPGAVFYDIAATTRVFYVVKPDASGFAVFGGGGSAGLVLVNWDASTNTPPLVSGGATNVSYQNITPDRTTLSPAIDGITFVDQYDLLVPTTGGTFSKVLANSGFPVATTFNAIWDTSAAKDMGTFTVVGALALTSTDVNSIVGGYTMATIIANGTNIPTFDGVTISNWNNTNGARNRVELRRTGGSKYWTVGANAGTAIQTPVAATITSAPVLNAISNGNTVTWTDGGVAGTPTPTKSFSLKKNGTVVSSPATSGSYTYNGAGSDIFIVTQGATNAAYGGGTATPVDSAPVTATAGFPLFSSAPSIVLLGDSHTQFSNSSVSLPNSMVVTRSASGVVTGTVTNSQYGTPRCVFVNMPDETFERIGRGNRNATSTITVGGVAGSGTTIAVYNELASAATTTMPSSGSFGALINFEQFDTRGWFAWAQSKVKGVLNMVGNLGHGGASAPFTSPTAYAGTLAPTLIAYCGGTNNIKGGQSGATAWAAVKQDLDYIAALNSGAGIPCLVLDCPPLGVANNGTTWGARNLNEIGDPDSTTVTTSLNYLKKQYCLANPSKFLHVPIFNTLVDKVTDPSNWRMNANYNTDGTHTLSTGSKVWGEAVGAALAPQITAVPTPLPSSAADAGTTVNGHVRLATGTRGPWTSATVAVGNTGGSGQVPSGWGAGRNSGSGTVVASLVDPGDGLGYKVTTVMTPNAVNDQCVIWPWGSNGVSPTTLGISASDNAEYCVVCEVDWSGGTASGLGSLQLIMQTNASGAYGTVTFGNTVELAGAFPDSGSGVVMSTGWLQMSDVNITTLVISLIAKFTSITGTAANVAIRRVQILKK